MGFFKKKETPEKKQEAEISTHKEPLVKQERVITAAGFTRKALSKIKKTK